MMLNIIKTIRELKMTVDLETNKKFDLYIKQEITYKDLKAYLKNKYQFNGERSSFHADYYDNYNLRKNNNFDIELNDLRRRLYL